ncbi:unnamed protein product [Rotaria sp. Silwood2]|nr:unnamed protein product [Rotaria sp. Silwood2]CAF2634738.1 unnamed protein product [Rotaria sp. Silwood2]CAF3036880.1 unnamed protein product [Rotaria sp. Silwood2]CAF3991330.1 unnamed protein product [Rotaria sp. Silwood2]CAF3999789.1 unnamed protein product [Rotaria sp. Silwood2]
MDHEEMPRFAGGLRPSDETAIEESGLLGTRRGWANINRYEIIFLIVGILAAIATDSLTIVRLTDIHDTRDPDFAYAILILVNSIFLLLFLVIGIFYQRITHIVAFFISAVMLTIYVIVHYAARSKESDDHSKAATLRLIRLIFTIIFNICFIPLAILVIRDYRRDEFSKRLFGAFPTARRPLKIYNIFDCLAVINTMLSISTFVLNLYNFNHFEAIDTVLLSVGIPLSLLWLGIGIGMVRLENLVLVAVFYLISLFQPGFLGYSLYSAIDNSPTSLSTTTTITTTTTTSTISTLFLSSSTIKAFDLEITTTPFTTISTSTPKVLVSVPKVLYVCIAANFLTHILSMIFASICIRNFGKGLKEKIFNNRLDKWFQKRWSTT